MTTPPEYRPPQPPGPGFATDPTVQLPHAGAYSPVSAPQSAPPPASAPYPQPASWPAGAAQAAHQNPAAAPGARPVRTPLRGVWVLALVSVVCVALGLSVSENGASAWHSVNAWGGLAIVGALLTLTPAVRTTFGLNERRAWQAAACGAAALILFWVLFTLPSVGSNTSLLTTIGVGAGVMAAWIAPGRDAGLGDARPPR